MVSRRIELVAFLMIGLIVGVAIGYGYMLTSISPGKEETITYNIGIIVPLTGALSDYGAQQRIAAVIAVEDMNAQLEKTGSNIRFNLLVEDGETTAAGAMKAITSLSETFGVKAVISCSGSVCAVAIKKYVDSNHICVIAPDSSTGTLSGIKDFIFRYCNDAKFEAKVVADQAEYFGKKVVSVYRDDPWGTGLHESFTDMFTGEVKGIRIAPELPDYSSEVLQLKNDVEEFGAENTVVALLTFEAETINIVSHMMEYPILHKITIIGPTALTHPGVYPPKAPTEIADYMIECNAHADVKTKTLAPGASELLDRVKAVYGTPPTTEILNNYDACTALMLSILVAGKYDGDAIAKTVPFIATKHMGYSGYKVLDEWGELLCGEYSIAKLTKTPEGEYTWEEVGKWTIAGISWGE